jgi:3-phenylpropionate/trans-cinnamate dioxygenase ferredoxin reductase subunit
MAAYVIVGASLAGATAAITLRDEGVEGTVTLIGAEHNPPYERPPLSKGYLRGDVPFDKALVRPTAFYAEHGIQTMFGTRATRIDPSARFVELEDRRRVPFDKLLIATGGRNRPVSIPGGDLEGIYSLRTVQDADRIREEMVAGRRVVVVGMGFIGSEVAASLRQKGLDVVAIDPSKTPLFRVLGEAVGETIAELHRAHGVRTIFEDTVAAFEGSRRVGCVVTKGGLRLECDFAVVGIGIDPAVEVLGGSGIHVDNGVVVDEYCQTNVSGVYAAGDVANHYTRSSIAGSGWNTGRTLSSKALLPHVICSTSASCTTRSTGSGLTSTTRTCSTPDSTPSGSSSLYAVAWTPLVIWRAM